MVELSRRDVARTAEMLGLPYAPPNPDPIVMDLKSGEVVKEQPYIGRLTRLGVAAAELGKGLQLLEEVSAVIFGGTRNWHLGDHLARAVARSGLDPTELDRAIEAKKDAYEATIAGNEAAQERGSLGLPLMVFEDELVLRPGSLRDAQMAHGAERTEAAGLVFAQIRKLVPVASGSADKGHERRTFRPLLRSSGHRPRMQPTLREGVRFRVSLILQEE